MTCEEQASSPIGYFALACERMNGIARSLRESSFFETVTTGADIRYYQNGWRLEKWVEAELDRTEGLWAVWWLELGPCENGWLVESNFGLNPQGLSVYLEDRFAGSLSELEQHLSAAVEDLELALEQNREFAEEVKKRRTSPDN